MSELTCDVIDSLNKRWGVPFEVEDQLRESDEHHYAEWRRLVGEIENWKSRHADEVEKRLSLAEDYADILTVANRNGAIVNQIIEKKELPNALALLGRARNWVQDPVLRVEIQALVPPTPRTAEDS